MCASARTAGLAAILVTGILNCFTLAGTWLLPHTHTHNPATKPHAQHIQDLQGTILLKTQIVQGSG